MNIHMPFGARALCAVLPAALTFSVATADPVAAKTDDIGTPTASVANNTLTITGTDDADAITISLAADPNTLVVSLSPSGANDLTFDRATFTAISVALRSGGDRFSVLSPSPDEQLIVHGGPGADAIFGGDFNDLLFGNGDDDTINGGSGDDQIFGGLGDDAINGGRGRDTAFMDNGRDAFVWNPGDGSDFVDGDNGRDAMVFNGANVDEKMSLSANGKLAVFLRNIGTIRMDLDSVEEVDVTALGGSDSLEVGDMRGTDVEATNVNLAAGAGGPDLLADSVTIAGTDRQDHIRVAARTGIVSIDGLATETNISGSELLDHLQLNTFGGNDRVDVDANVGSLVDVGIDLGADQH
jgi:hypothetical protein